MCLSICRGPGNHSGQYCRLSWLKQTIRVNISYYGWPILWISPGQAIAPFLITSSSDKIRENWKSNERHVVEIHEKIWPGEPIDKLRSKHYENVAGAEDQTIWFRESTMPTSMLVSFVVFALSNKYRTVRVRAKTAEGFSTLCSMVFSHLQGTVVPHTQHGTDDHVNLDVTTTGTVCGSHLWSPDFFRRRVKRTWIDDFQNESKPWLTHENGLGTVFLSEYLVFCLDPQHSVDLRNELLGPTWTLFSYIALHLDESVERLQANAQDVSMCDTDFKNKKRTASNVKTVWCEMVASKVWKQEDAKIWPGNQFWRCVVFWNFWQWQQS